MTHGEPHFETAFGAHICLCMCSECFRDDAQEGEVACICPECDHHAHPTEGGGHDEDKIGPPDGIGSADSVGG